MSPYTWLVRSKYCVAGGPEEAIPLAYWRDKLGSTYDLGHLPEVSSFGRFSPCAVAEKTGCVDFLEVHLTGPLQGTQQLLIPVEVEGLPFVIQMQAESPQRTYYILLDRIWFWKIAKDHGGQVRVLDEKLPTNVEVKMIAKQEKTDVLY